MVSGRLSVKRNILATIGKDEFGLDRNAIAKVARKTLTGYQERIAKETVESNFDKKAGDALKKELVKDPRQLVQRVQNEVVYQIHQGIKDKYSGRKARWLPSDADEPRPEHQLNYGKEYIIGEGIDGVEPGDEYGCLCGLEILTDDTKLDIT